MNTDVGMHGVGNRGTLRPAPLRRGAVAALAALVLVLTAASPQNVLSGGDGWPRGAHPWPRGDEWPAGLHGPFESSVTRQSVEMDDGIRLRGAIVRPAVPEGVRVPVVLWSTPYFGGMDPAPDDPALWDNSWAPESVPVNLLVAEGYAVAIFNVRGTGHSEGCWDWFSSREQRDQQLLVEWLGEQPWTNGRVGMMGLSYGGTTPIEAAIGNPAALKTIVIAGTISDPYTFYHTPQGAYEGRTWYSAELPFTPVNSIVPPARSPDRFHGDEWLAAAPQRVCEQSVRSHAATGGSLVDARDAAHFDERFFLAQMPRISSSVLLAHGFQDCGHCWQEDLMWRALERAPKRQLIGHWGHEFPNFNSFKPELTLPDWNERLLEWLDFWLKGVGSPPGVGTVEYRDMSGGSYTTTAWPPREAREEVLYLGSRLSPSDTGETRTFRSVPLSTVDVGHLGFCPGTDQIGLMSVSDPLPEAVVLAGNPHAYLSVSSDQPAGFLGVSVLAIPEHGGTCHAWPADTLDGTPPWQRMVAWGIADLRHHQGNLVAQDFPVGEPTKVRIDLTNTAMSVPAGARLAVFIYHGDSTRTTNRGWYPNLTIHGDGGSSASHVVLPFVEGTLGGKRPTLRYPPRPFSLRPERATASDGSRL